MSGSDRTGWAPLDALLKVDDVDAGCAHALHVLATYAEFVISGADAAAAHPAVTAHLRGCGPCHEDVDGLLALLAGRM